LSPRFAIGSCSSRFLRRRSTIVLDQFLFPHHTAPNLTFSRRAVHLSCTGLLVAHGRACLLLDGATEGLPAASRLADAVRGLFVELEAAVAAALGEQALHGLVAGWFISWIRLDFPASEPAAWRLSGTRVVLGLRTVAFFVV
jgi:hypothetical protein